MAQSHIDDLLTCAICLDRFELPKQLPCQHTFCLAPCLEALVENRSVRCPECRAVHRLPQNGAKGFPNNLMAVQLLDVPAQTKPSTDTSCQECTKRNCLFGKCLHCDQILCRECLNKRTKTFNAELNQLISKVENRTPEVSRQIAGLDHKQERMNENKQLTLLEIEQWYDRCLSALQLKKKKLVDETMAFWNSETRKLKEKREDLETELAVISSFCENAKRETKKASSSVEITRAQESLIEMMKETKKLLEEFGEDTTEKHAKFCTEEAQAILDSISELRSISTSIRPTAPIMMKIGRHIERRATCKTSFSDARGSAIPTGPGFNPAKQVRSQTSSPSTPNSATGGSTTSPSDTHHHQFGLKDRTNPVSALIGTQEDAERQARGQASSPSTSKLATGSTFNLLSRLMGNISRVATLQRHRKKGAVKKCFGRKGSDVGCFYFPVGVSVTHDDKIIVADTNNHRIQIFDTSGNSISTFGHKGKRDGEFNKPFGICVTSSGQIVVADKDNHRIQVFDMKGTFISTFGEGKLSRPRSVATNSDGLLYISDGSNIINVFSLNGDFIRSFGESWLDSSGNVKFLTVTHDNKVVVAENTKNRIGVFDSDGELLRQIGEKGNGPGQFIFPCGVACDQYGNIIVADGNNRIQIFDSDGNFISSFGSYGSKPGEMYGPSGVAVFRNGDIVVSDFYNNRIQIF